MLLINIEQLIGVTRISDHIKKGKEQGVVAIQHLAFLWIKDGIIEDFGPMELCPKLDADVEILDLKNKSVLPCFIDSHTHFVFAESRSAEFEMRLMGKTYQEIAASGGGILNSAEKITKISENQLICQTEKLVNEAISMGTGAMEIKSGYGLFEVEELKMLRVIDALRKQMNIPIKSTFLAAHAIPLTFQNNADGYVDYMINEVLPKVAAQKLANYIDVFCETGYFTPEQMKKILFAGANFQLKSKVHVNQFSSIGGVQVAVEAKSLTVDHLEVMTETDIQILKKSQTIAVALPICSLFLDIPYTPVRRLINEGIPIVLASDFNPGSSPSYNLSLAFHLACSQMKLNVNEAFNALTYNAAFALELQHEMGSIQKGKRANLIITKEGFDLVDFPYWVGRNIIEDVLVF